MGLAGSLLLSGCEVFVDFGLKNTTLEMYESHIPGTVGNMSVLLLPDYEPDNPDYRYIIHFFGGDRVTGTYYAADTLNYVVEGTWSLSGPDVLRVDLDAFIDADFLITKLDKHTYLLKTESNAHGLPFGPPTTPLHLYNRKVY